MSRSQIPIYFSDGTIKHMKRFLISTIINGLGIWLVSAIIPGIGLKPYGGNELWQLIATLLVIGAIFGLINSIIAPVIKVIAFPLYILTFGLISFVINGSLLLLVAWISQQLSPDTFTIEGFTTEGLEIESLGWAILASIVISICSFIGRGIFKALRIL
jgi:putative membrane protein